MSETKVPDSSNATLYEPPFLADQFDQILSLPDGNPDSVNIQPDELDVFRDFITKHVRAIGNADVQCMLIWAEWVRFHTQRTKKFPRLILEQEFKDVITGLFGTTINLDGYRGRVYPGIRFVP